MRNELTETQKQEVANGATHQVATFTHPSAIVAAPATNTEAEIARAEATKAEALVKLAEILPSLGRGDKTFIRAAARELFGIAPKRKTAATTPKFFFTGEKSLSLCAQQFGIENVTSKTVFEAMEKAGIVTKGKVKGYVLKSEYGRTLKPNSEARPMFNFEGARRAFKEVGLIS